MDEKKSGSDESIIKPMYNVPSHDDRGELTTYPTLDLKVGYVCNNNCMFCAQATNRVKGNKSTQQIKQELDNSFERGCRRVVFTGGECTIRKDIVELVRHAAQKGYKVIQIQTNGRMFAYPKFCDEMIGAGANEFAVALHGHIPAVHDYLTRSKGAFVQTTQGIKNLKARGVPVITNTVIVKPNYRHAPEMAKLLLSLGVDQSQFAFVHACGNATEYYDQMMPFVSMAAPYIHKGLQVFIDNGVNCMAEAMPYCVMKGYEKQVSEIYIPYSEIREYDHLIEDYGGMRRNELKSKFPQCKECKYELICEGPWKEYPEHKGSSEFIPVPGPKIKHVKEIFSP